MQTDLQNNLPPSHVERGIEGLAPTLVGTHQKPLKDMLLEFTGALMRGEEVNIHELCCGMGVASEQIQFLMNALCIAAGTRNRASVVGSDVNPLNEERLNHHLDLFHEIALDDLREWEFPGVDVDALKRDSALAGPQARFVRSSADQPIAHPGPLDLAFCVHGIWYVEDKLGMIYNTVDGLRQGSGLAVWDSFNLDSVRIAHTVGSAWQGNYKLKDFLRDHGGQRFDFHLQPGDSRSQPIHTLCARRPNLEAAPRPKFVKAVPSNAPSPVDIGFWNYATFRRDSEYKFAE